jgi:hypothetical protein
VNVAAIYHDEKTNQWDVWEKGLPAMLAGLKIPVLLGVTSPREPRRDRPSLPVDVLCTIVCLSYVLG